VVWKELGNMERGNPEKGQENVEKKKNFGGEH
jgi:hypothetical protein